MNTVHFASPSVRSTRARTASRGFTLIESMIAVGIAGVLSSVAYPSLEGHVFKAKRTDALVALMQAQMAEERYRADHFVYGDMADLGLRATSSSGNYTLQLAVRGGDGFTATATAAGRQARDTACRTMRLVVDGSSVSYTSGPDAASTNAADLNRKCWNQ